MAKRKTRKSPDESAYIDDDGYLVDNEPHQGLAGIAAEEEKPAELKHAVLAISDAHYSQELEDALNYQGEKRDRALAVLAQRPEYEKVKAEIIEYQIEYHRLISENDVNTMVMTEKQKAIYYRAVVEHGRKMLNELAQKKKTE